MEKYSIRVLLQLIISAVLIDAYLKPPCKDAAEESICWLLEKSGQCQKDSVRMRLYCKKTCGFCYSCEDYLIKQRCDELKSFGACRNNHKKMKGLCPETCGFCPKNCKDTYSRCKELKLYNACITHPERMKTLCPDTCGFCKPRTACDGYFCPIGFSCHLTDNGKPNCVCNSECSKTGNTGPVCTKDGKTFPHLCALKKEECKLLAFIPVNYYGACKKPIACADESREAAAGLCKEWKAVGACQDHVAIMEIYCRKTCDMCRVSRNPPKPKCLETEFGCCWNGADVAKKGKYGEGCAPCIDLKFCKAFRGSCGSRISHEVMKLFCPFTCGYCLPERQKIILKRDREIELMRRKLTSAKR